MDIGLKSKEIEKYEGNEFTYSRISYGLEMKTLEREKEYCAEELNVLGVQAGYIAIEIENEEASAEKLASGL